MTSSDHLQSNMACLCVSALYTCENYNDAVSFASVYRQLFALISLTYYVVGSLIVGTKLGQLRYILVYAKVGGFRDSGGAVQTSCGLVNECCFQRISVTASEPSLSIQMRHLSKDIVFRGCSDERSITAIPLVKVVGKFLSPIQSDLSNFSPILKIIENLSQTLYFFQLDLIYSIRTITTWNKTTEKT